MIRAHLPSNMSWPLDFFTEGQGEYQLVVETDARMEVNMYGHYGVRYFRWPTIREYFDHQQENQKP